jgi:hypothetical protein
VIYANILKLYTDKVHGKIRMGCKDIYQTHRSLADQVKCSNAVHLGEVGGYAFSYSEKLEDNTIVMCKPFFQPGQELLKGLIKELGTNKGYQKDPHQMNGKTRMLLHEITHLAAMSETSSGKRHQSSPTVVHVTHQKTVVVKDQPLREEAVTPQKVYGPALVQKMGAHKLQSVRNRSQKNGM